MLGWDSSQKILKILKVKDWNSGMIMGFIVVPFFFLESGFQMKSSGNSEGNQAVENSALLAMP